MPPLNEPSFARLIASNTAASTPFTIDVRMKPGASAYWSASTPMASLREDRAASKTPSPVDPDAWKMMFTPDWYWLSASSLPRPGFRNASGVTPAYCAITVQSGHSCFTPAR